MDDVLSYLTKHEQAHLEWATELCRFPTVSTLSAHKDDLVLAARWLQELATSIGLEAQIMETGGHPSVFAEYHAGADKPTYLVYGHYDVQPVGEEKLWDQDAFEPVVKDDWLICRGAADDKAQFLVYFRAAAAWLATRQTLPVNLKFLIEGEEEIGSPNLAAFIEQHQDLLKCDHILISDTGLYQDGWPTITYGTRGLLYKEIILSGPTFNLHSGSFGGTVANPAHVLAELLAGLHDEDGRVALPGFYDKVAKPEPEERDALNSLPFNDEQYAEQLGVPKPYGETGYSTNERRWIRPTLECNGVYGGFMGEGANTIVPAKAGAKISLRLVPNQSSKELSELFDRTIKERCPDTVRLEIGNHGQADAYVAPLDAPIMAAARAALEETFERDVALVREGGSLPILPMFKERLGVDCLMLGLASPDCAAHGPNEKIYLPDLNRGTQAIARLFAKLAD